MAPVELESEEVTVPGVAGLDSVAATFEHLATLNRTLIAVNDAATTRWASGGVETTDLVVYHAEVDPETGEPLGDATTYDLSTSGKLQRVVLPHQYANFVSQAPFFVSVDDRVYFVETPEPTGAGVAEEPAEEEDVDEAESYTKESKSSGMGASKSKVQNTRDRLQQRAAAEAASSVTPTYRYSSFFHPHVCTFIEAVRRDGIFGLLDPEPTSRLFRQELSLSDFDGAMKPTDAVEAPYTSDGIDFSWTGAYAAYNWELFFHLPFYIATRLADEQRFDEALTWFHTMFDPRTRTPVEGGPEGSTWWKVHPFTLSSGTPVTDWIAFSGVVGSAQKTEFEAQVAAWREDPFNPHLIARLRPGTYPKTVVMRYIQTLIAWGDQLFTRDTIESINEATQLYVFARQVLGDRPMTPEPAEDTASLNFDELAADGLDPFGNSVIEAVENQWTEGSGIVSRTSYTRGADTMTLTPYFCVPPNPSMFASWDLVEDRLFKVRNGMNIAGIARSLALYEPPIDPALLARSAAAGVDLASVVSEIGSTRPGQRFVVWMGRAQALAGTVRALGGALLSALEKQDGEALALLRQEHERTMLEAVAELRERQVEEATSALEATKASRSLAEQRIAYYEGLIDRGWLPSETAAALLNSVADASLIASGVSSAMAAAAAPLPQVHAGLCAGIEAGGEQLAKSPLVSAQVLSNVAAAARGTAGFLTVTASYKRREQEWAQQQSQAQKELTQIDQQIAAAELRLQIAQKERTNHSLQMAQSSEVHEWMTSKFSNQELYAWMVGQVSSLYFQTYELARATAKKAETCYQFELGRSDSFVQSVYWDNLRRGLLAGERLAADLERMDMAYLEHDVREREVVKHVSLARLDPEALIALQTGGTCVFTVPEVLFDLDFPGHYFRRIQSVSVSIPCVAGAQQGVNATLTLSASRVRSSTSLDPGYLEDGAPDPRFELDSTTETVALSGAMDDAGVFQLDPRDPKYLPFERRGVITTWQLTLPGASSLGFAQLDWNSITDVVLRFRYTARDGGSTFAAAAGAPATLRSALNLLPNASATGTGVTLAWSARRDFPNEWHLAQTPDANLNITLTTDLLPYWMQGRTLAVNRINAWYVPLGTLGSTGTPAATWTPVSGSPTSFGGSWNTSAPAALASLTPTAAPNYADNTELSVDPGDLSLEATYVVDLILVLQVTTS